MGVAFAFSLIGLYIFRKSVQENKKESIIYINNMFAGIFSGIFVAYAVYTLVNQQANLMSYALVIAMMFLILGLGSALAVWFKMPKKRKRT